MHQYYTFDKPIPSLPVYKISLVDNKWNYTYEIVTPLPLRDKPFKTPLYLDGSLLNLKLTKECPKGMINIPIHSKQDLIKLFNTQRISDNKLRREFKQTELAKVLTEQTFTIKNKNQKMFGAYIVRQKRKTATETIFVGREK